MIGLSVGIIWKFVLWLFKKSRCYENGIVVYLPFFCWYHIGVRLKRCRFLEGDKNQNNCLWEIFPGFWNFPRFSPICFTRRKAREISKTCEKLLSRKDVLNFRTWTGIGKWKESRINMKLNRTKKERNCDGTWTRTKTGAGTWTG